MKVKQIVLVFVIKILYQEKLTKNTFFDLFPQQALIKVIMKKKEYFSFAMRRETSVQILIEFIHVLTFRNDHLKWKAFISRAIIWFTRQQTSIDSDHMPVGLKNKSSHRIWIGGRNSIFFVNEEKSIFETRPMHIIKCNYRPNAL